jgi:tRNA threonylcarbamoyl adenosine modification protein YeaZ
VIVLVVDTSTPAVAAGLVRVGGGWPGGDAPSSDEAIELLAERTTVDARAHGERLAPEIDEVLRETGRGVRDLTAIVAGLGPGPFTGLRVGLVTAAAMGQALVIPTYGVCSLDAIGAGTDGDALVATDARRKEIYWAHYTDGCRISEPAVGRPADVAVMLAAATTAAGDGALLYAGTLGLPTRPPRYPSLLALVGLAAGRVRRHAPSESLSPLYLRRPDAVEPSSRKVVSQ